MDWDNNLGKKSDPKNRKKSVIIKVKLPHVHKKPLTRNENSVQTKNQAQNELRMDWDNNLGKKSDPKNRKKSVIIKVKLPHVNKKTTSEKWKFGSNKKLGLE